MTPRSTNAAWSAPAAADRERLGARGGGDDVAAPAGQRRGEIVALSLLRVRDENRLAEPSSSTRAGSNSENVVPSLTTLSTVIWPPWSRTMP